MRKQYKAGDKLAELKPLNTEGNVTFHLHIPPAVRKWILERANDSEFDIQEVDAIDGDAYPFEFGYANKYNISCVMERYSWRERMLLWLDIITHSPGQLPHLRDTLESEEDYV